MFNVETEILSCFRQLTLKNQLKLLSLIRRTLANQKPGTATARKEGEDKKEVQSTKSSLLTL
jgi:hypothetical protein